jgi:hypothetical protein
MLKISEVREIIDELEQRISSYSDKSVWQKTSQTDWYTFIIDKGPKIVDSWRELAALISLTSGDQLLELQAKWEMFQNLTSNPEVLQLALKFKRTDAPPKGE